MSFRPGPETIDPGLCPGGLVAHVYRRDGELLLERGLTIDNVDASAFTDPDVVADRSEGQAVCFVIYDGDTGARWKPADYVRAGLLDEGEAVPEGPR